MKYLIQVNPPGDILPEVIRAIILMQNITDAGILFDDSFSKFSYVIPGLNGRDCHAQ